MARRLSQAKGQAASATKTIMPLAEGWRGKVTKVCPAGILLSNQKKQPDTDRHSLGKSQGRFAKQGEPDSKVEGPLFH